MAESLSVGLELRTASDVDVVGAAGTSAGFSFGLLDLLRPEVQSHVLLPANKVAAALEPEQLQMTENSWASFIVGGIAAGGALESEDDPTRQKCEALVRQQIHWAAHLGLSAVMFTYPTDAFDCVNFPRVVSRSVGLLSYTQAWLRVSLKNGNGAEAWRQWNLVRSLGEHNPKLSVALEIGSELPEIRTLQQWFAEPVRCVILPTSSFMANSKGYPVLSKAHQEFLRKLMEQQTVQFVVSAEDREERLHPQGGLAAYEQYLQHLNRTRPALGIVDQFAHGYHDYLQSPLQPLMDNLESATYEVFEKDPIKYQEYERAMHRALSERVSEVDAAATVTVLMVVGAGRGPIVQCALQAAKSANRRVKVYAVEKNPNAIVTLRNRKAQEWGDAVEVVHCDMRYWEAPEKCDILVSELLGSFGDNELSPECLDGAQRFLKDSGISIPSDYTAYISPMSSTKLYNEVSAYKDLEHMETPYVVKFRSVHELAEPKPVWTFSHPDRVQQAELGSPNFNNHNTRTSTQRFQTSTDSLLHGISGYFEATLYKDVMISIHPQTHSPGMFSWFPIFFPLQTPIYLPAGSKVDLNFWRLCDARKVWYEWSATPVAEDANGVTTQMLVGGASAIHNRDGRSSWIGL
ncbi:Protein arginine N-methyltransferase 5 [Thoreauomyces humboldtii]|nr:Protein arginine N-methyltransferase 5 [Thoreauomyces humboldtii]